MQEKMELEQKLGTYRTSRDDYQWYGPRFLVYLRYKVTHVDLKMLLSIMKALVVRTCVRTFSSLSLFLHFVLQNKGMQQTCLAKGTVRNK